MHITQLRYFAAIAQLENMSQAAQLLHLSQSSLSKNLSKLEAEVGTPLFDRSGRKLTLNAAGARLLEYSALALRELDCALDDIRLLSTGGGVRIRIGAAGANDRLTACIAAFHRTRPEAEFDLDSDIEGADRLDINDYDMLIYPAGGRYEKFSGSPLYTERYRLAVARRHPLADAPSVRAKALSGEHVVFLRKGRTFVEFPSRICSALEVGFASRCYVDARELHRQMISSGYCVGFVPESGADFYRLDRELRLIPIQDRRFSRQMMVCFRREKRLSNLARDFRDFAVDYFGLKGE